MGAQIAISLTDDSQVGEARRIAARYGEFAGLNEEELGKSAIVITELSKNLRRHAREGQIILRWSSIEHEAGLEILALDRGPGMASIDQCLEDGYSTYGTSGTGLGAVRRLSHVFEVYSECPSGTIILSRFFKNRALISSNLKIGVVSLPVQGEFECGDAWKFVQKQNQISFIVVDGLGHGPLAASAARTAVESFDENPFEDLNTRFNEMHKSMRATRGGAVTLGQADLDTGTLKYAGVGNVSGRLFSAASSKGLISHNGTVGAEMRKTQVFEYEWSKDMLLAVYSDGMKTQWNIGMYPGLIFKDPSLIAAMLYRDFARGRDDFTTLVIRPG